MNFREIFNKKKRYVVGISSNNKIEFIEVKEKNKKVENQPKKEDKPTEE